MGKETDKIRLVYQKQSKLIGFIGLILSLVSTLVYLGISVGESKGKIENLESFAVETKADIRNIDNEINAMSLINSRELNDLTNDIILINATLSALRDRLNVMEKRIHSKHKGRRK